MANAINRGERLGATLVNKMAAAAMGAGQFRVSSGRGSGGPLGTSMSTPLAPEPDDNVIECVATHTQLAFTVVEVCDAKAASVLDLLPIARLPARWASSNVGVLLANSVPDRIVPVQIAGVCLLKYEWHAGDDLKAGDRLTARHAYFWPTKCSGGPFLVIAVAAHDVLWTNYNYALVSVTHNRLGTVYVRDAAARVHGACAVLVVGTGLTVTEISKGVVNIA